MKSLQRHGDGGYPVPTKIGDELTRWRREGIAAQEVVHTYDERWRLVEVITKTFYRNGDMNEHRREVGRNS